MELLCCIMQWYNLFLETPKNEEIHFRGTRTCIHLCRLRLIWHDRQGSRVLLGKYSCWDGSGVKRMVTWEQRLLCRRQHSRGRNPEFHGNEPIARRLLSPFSFLSVSGRCCHSVTSSVSEMYLWWSLNFWLLKKWKRRADWIVKIHQIASTVLWKKGLNSVFPTCCLCWIITILGLFVFFFPLPFPCSEILSNLIL